MDSTALNPVAETPPFAADPQGGFPGSGPEINPAQTTPPNPVGAPDGSVPPQETAPLTPTAPQFSEQEYRAAQAKAQQFDQVTQELRQLAQQQQQQQVEQAAQQEIQSRLDAAYQTAQNMEPEKAITYIRQVEDRERANLQRMVRETREMSEREKYAAVAQIAAPLYAQELAARHNLPPEYAQRLAMLPPQQMDQYLPVLVREHTDRKATEGQVQQLMNELNQLKRSQQAGQYAANGAHVPTGAGVTPLGSAQGNVQPGTDAHLLSNPAIARMFGINPTQ